MPSFTPLAKRILRLKPKQETLPGIEISERIKKKREAKSKKNGRRAIVILFFLTIFASGIFYLKTELPVIWQKLLSPVVISTLPEGSVFDPSPVLEDFEVLTEDLQGTYGFYVYRLGLKKSYGVRNNEIFTAASLIKLPVMLAVYQEAEKGALDLEEYRGKLEAMGNRSDNAAFNRMVKLLGDQKIQTVIDSLEMKKTSFKNNETTPVDIGLFFQKLYQGGIISNQYRDEFLAFLTDTIWEGRIPAGIPEGVRVAHKIGTEVGTFADAGIIFGEKPFSSGEEERDAFILVIMSDKARENEANQVLPKIAQLVWEFEMAN